MQLVRKAREKLRENRLSARGIVVQMYVTAVSTHCLLKTLSTRAFYAEHHVCQRLLVETRETWQRLLALRQMRAEAKTV